MAEFGWSTRKARGTRKGGAGRSLRRKTPGGLNAKLKL